jgi:cell fate regulator YaaT (PSP1 superfamily)
MDTIRTEITEESREVEILEGDRQIEITEKTLEVIEETAVVEAETADAVAAAEAEVATEEAEAADEADSEEEAGEKFEESATAESEKDNTEETVSDGKKVRVIGVRFRTAGKVYYFDPGEWKVVHGGHVIVETVRGIEYGTVVGLPMEIDARKVTQPLKEVIRVATPEDTETEILNRVKEREAYRICQEKIQAHGLDMKLINAEYTFDNSKVLFYFTADGRVDFRDLVKDLASVFRTRIELRQIGVRDETKILGGYGICGRPLCCHTWMSDFIPVSIKMAKEQNLSLNPTKISGVCGRLMCCLKNEADTYEELNRNLPKVGDEVRGNDVLSGQVESVNVLRQTVRILVEVDDEKEYHEYHVDDVTILRRRRRGGNRSRKEAADPKEVQELEKLENQDRQMSGGGRGDRHGRGDRQNRNGDETQNRTERGSRRDRGERQNRNGNDGQERSERQNRNGNDGQERGERNNRRGNRRRNNGNEQHAE